MASMKHRRTSGDTPAEWHSTAGRVEVEFLRDKERGGGAELYDRQFHSISLLSGFDLALFLCLSRFVSWSIALFYS